MRATLGEFAQRENARGTFVNAGPGEVSAWRVSGVP
jgi:hypothetical protein